ncbi:MAG: hypothetical protein OXR82_05450 [Gammaproteobacteria bacterium]|nr:hypothetical protein [Gammaproteobacteria bacterium]MDE0257820.1 hypothetical protein [Gammaproteobacteria bacterium]
MKRSRRSLSLLLALGLTLLACRSAAAPEPPWIAGEWEGINHNAHPPHYWHLDLDAHPEGRVTGTFGINPAGGNPTRGTIEGSHRDFAVVLHASGTTREISCIIHGVDTGDGLNTNIDCGWDVSALVFFWRVR